METVSNARQRETMPIGIRPIHELLTSRGWKQCNNNNSDSSATYEVSYNKDPTRDDEFRIRITTNNICIAVPIAKAAFLFASSFKSYFLATEFVERHLDTYEESMAMASSNQ